MASYIELRDTVEMMNSSDYKERFRAEYFQLKIRYDKLRTMLTKWDNGKLEFTPTCSRSIYDAQVQGMQQYLTTLEKRAAIENVDISSSDDTEC